MKPFPNIYVSINEDGRDVSFDCPGPCKFGLFFEMPPPPDSRCSWNRGGTCVLPEARTAALEAARRYCGQELKSTGREAA